MNLTKKINASIINDDECWNLIKQYFKAEKSAFYQINSFIDIFANQLFYFSKNFNLEIVNIQYGNKNYKNIWIYFNEKMLNEIVCYDKIPSLIFFNDNMSFTIIYPKEKNNTKN